MLSSEKLIQGGETRSKRNCIDCADNAVRCPGNLRFSVPAGVLLSYRQATAAEFAGIWRSGGNCRIAVSNGSEAAGAHDLSETSSSRS
jgi:hypothetical protein